MNHTKQPLPELGLACISLVIQKHRCKYLEYNVSSRTKTVLRRADFQIVVSLAAFRL